MCVCVFWTQYTSRLEENVKIMHKTPLAVFFWGRHVVVYALTCTYEVKELEMLR